MTFVNRRRRSNGLRFSARGLTRMGLWRGSQAMRLLAPAKINLHLRVAPADDTGFHPLMSWMCTVGLFDTLTIEHTTGGGLSLQCDDATLPCDQTNLVMRAAAALQAATPGQSQAQRGAAPDAATLVHDPGRRSAGASLCPGVGMHLEKCVPARGGLGGGSSDAARTLLGLNQLWQLRLGMDQLARISASLGSDVPFFLHGPSAVCTGRGEKVHPIARPLPRWVVLILPGLAIATPAVYAMFDRMRLGERDLVATQPNWQQWAELSAGPLLVRLVNDLEPPSFALCPQLASLRADVEQTLGQPVRMSGSGSSLFTLFDDQAEAQRAAQRVTQQHHVRALATELAPQIDDDLHMK